MKSSTFQFLETVFSVLAFAVIALAIATTAVHIFNPEGGLISWVGQEWDHHPVMLALLGVVLMVVKFWLQSMQSARAANLLFYGALLLGTFYAVRMFMA